MGWGKFKPLLSDATIAAIEPIQNRYKELMKDQGEVHQILDDGARQAQEVADLTLNRIKDALGLLSSKAR